MKNIGMDIDGVVADFNRALAIELGHSPVHTHPDRWDWPDALKDQVSVDRVWQHVTNKAEWWFDAIRPYAEAKDSPFLRNLYYMSEEHNLYFITARPQVPGMKMYTELWLKMHLKLTTPTLILAQDKGAVAAGIGLTHFVDDNPDNCQRVADATAGFCRTYILHRPYNSDFKHNNVERIRTLAGFTSAVNGHQHAVAQHRQAAQLQ